MEGWGGGGGGGGGEGRKGGGGVSEGPGGRRQTLFCNWVSGFQSIDQVHAWGFQYSTLAA